MNKTTNRNRLSHLQDDLLFFAKLNWPISVYLSLMLVHLLVVLTKILPYPGSVGHCSPNQVAV